MVNHISLTLGLPDLWKPKAASRARWTSWAHPVTWRRNKLLVKLQNSARRQMSMDSARFFTNCSPAIRLLPEATTYETIRLLLDTEPRPPRQLNPKIDRDLSTICLKCLEKDPKRRYSSALALGRRPGTLAKA